MKVLVTKDYLTNIATSIRNKIGNNQKYKVKDMSSAIEQINTLYIPRFISLGNIKEAN